MGDDIGYWNISAYNRGMMGYRTPNIDRIAAEGALFTDYYGQQSCTAGRAAFISGQSPMRTGLLKVGLPGAKEGLSDKDPTIADLLKPLGYMTGQFGKNHLGDRNEFLPSNTSMLSPVLRSVTRVFVFGPGGDGGARRNGSISTASRQIRAILLETVRRFCA